MKKIRQPLRNFPRKEKVQTQASKKKNLQYFTMIEKTFKTNNTECVQISINTILPSRKLPALFD